MGWNSGWTRGIKSLLFETIYSLSLSLSLSRVSKVNKQYLLKRKKNTFKLNFEEGNGKSQNNAKLKKIN